MPVAAIEAAAPVERAAISRFYRPELDALRFAAFFGVFASHFLVYSAAALHQLHLPALFAQFAALFPPAGAFGVDLFFLLSAYLITELLLLEKQRYGCLDVRKFYIRRILRIWPLYFVFLGIALLPWVNRHMLSPRQALFFLLLSGNWGYVFFLHFPLSLATPLWTVSIEEQFYLAWPPVVKRLNRRKILITGLLMLAGSMLVRIVLVIAGAPTLAIWCNTLAHLDPIAAGILIAILVNERVWAPSIPRRLMLAVAGIGLLLFCTTLHIEFHYQYAQPILINTVIGCSLIALGCCSIFLSVLHIPYMVPRPLIYLGKISYGLYIFHALGMLLSDTILKSVPHGMIRGTLRLAIGLGLTLGLAALSYRFVEGPFLRLKERYTRVISRPV